VIIIPDEVEDDYFRFLIDKGLAMSSVNFLRKLDGDEKFAQRVMARMEANSRRITGARRARGKSRRPRS
jgi:hypothetical protein